MNRQKLTAEERDAIERKDSGLDYDWQEYKSATKKLHAQIYKQRKILRKKKIG